MERQALIDASVQPGGRAPATGSLALVQAFVNTVDREHGPDLLDDGAGWAAWCTARGLRQDATPARARAIREALRHLLWENGHTAPADLDAAPDAAAAAATLDAEAHRLDLRPRFATASVEPENPGGALGSVLLATFAAMADGTWDRLKACPGKRCGWAFYDRSVNRSSSWCSMRICGGRVKARSYYQRQHP